MKCKRLNSLNSYIVILTLFLHSNLSNVINNLES